MGCSDNIEDVKSNTESSVDFKDIYQSGTYSKTAIEGIYDYKNNADKFAVRTYAGESEICFIVPQSGYAHIYGNPRLISGK